MLNNNTKDKGFTQEIKTQTCPPLLFIALKWLKTQDISQRIKNNAQVLTCGQQAPSLAATNSSWVGCCHGNPQQTVFVSASERQKENRLSQSSL